MLTVDPLCVLVCESQKHYMYKNRTEITVFVWCESRGCSDHF